MFFGHNGGVDTRLSGLKPRLRRHLSVPKPSGNTKQYKRRIGLRVGRRAGEQSMATVVAKAAGGHDVGSDGGAPVHLRNQMLGGQLEHFRLRARDAVSGSERLHAVAPHQVPAVETKVALGRGSALAEHAEICVVRHRYSH